MNIVIVQCLGNYGQTHKKFFIQKDVPGENRAKLLGKIPIYIIGHATRSCLFLSVVQHLHCTDIPVDDTITKTLTYADNTALIPYSRNTYLTVRSLKQANSNTED